jgi:hypothetical protein
MAYKNPNEEYTATSRINTGGLINLRLHEIHRKVYLNWENGRFLDVNTMLDIIWSELYADASPEHKEEIKKLDDEILEYSNQKIRFKKDRPEVLKAHAKMVGKIREKWLFLKTVEKKQGLGKAYVDEFEDDFD